MQRLRLLGPLAFLVSSLLLAVADVPQPDSGIVTLTLFAAGFLLLLAFWRGGVARLWHTRMMPPPARRVTIRIRCSR